MKFVIKHEIPGRIRIHVMQTRMSAEQADTLLYYLNSLEYVTQATVYGRTADACVCFTGEREPLIQAMRKFRYESVTVPEAVLANSGRKLNEEYKEKLVSKVVGHYATKLFLPYPLRVVWTVCKSLPYLLAGTAATWLFTRNVQKALSVLMVDFSCALKLAMPIAVLSAIRQAGNSNITVKGGKYMEAVAEAQTIVFDKTGTLTKAKPTVKMVVPFCETEEKELLRLAACLEEHFPHSMAKAVVHAAQMADLDHEEMHSKVEYIVAHGISSYVGDKRVIIGSAHFVFDDEGCRVREEYQSCFDALPEEYSHLYLAVDRVLAAVICIEDPLRPESAEVVRELKKTGFSKIVMMTGDSERTAAAVAARVGVDEYYSEVLPEDKARYIEKEKASGRRVLMVGDGVNDSPALSAADAGIAISDGAELAREIADITIAADDLHEIVRLKYLSNVLMKRINQNYRRIVGFNAALILFGVGGILQPTTSAMLHNASTILISLDSMRDL